MPEQYNLYKYFISARKYLVLFLEEFLFYVN